MDFTREPIRHNHHHSTRGPIIRRLSTVDALPVPLDALRLDLRIDDDDDGSTLERMEQAAADMIERRSGKVLLPGTFEALFDTFAALKVIRAPLRQVTELAILTDKNTWTAQDLDDFRIITGENDFEVGAYPGWTCPTVFMAERSIRIQYRAGYNIPPESGGSDGDELVSGDDDVAMPPLYRGVLIALTGHFYENREIFAADKLTEIESTAGGILNAIRTFW